MKDFIDAVLIIILDNSVQVFFSDFERKILVNG